VTIKCSHYTKKPKVRIKRQQASLGWAYRIYIDGAYMGAGLTRDAAAKSVPRLLAIYTGIKRKALPRA